MAAFVDSHASQDVLRFPGLLTSDPFIADRLQRYSETVHLSAAESLFYEGDIARKVFVIVRGALRAVTYLADGRRCVLSFHHHGDIVGFPTRSVYCATVEALQPVRAVAIARTAFNDALVETPSLLPQLSGQNEAMQRHVLALARMSPAEKIALFLKNEAERLNGPGARRVTLPMARSDIADHLGLTVETVSRIFTRLKSEGAIAVEGIKNIHFTNIDLIEAYAEGNGVTQSTPMAPTL
ncbi:MAG: Crp/Fnr family transcriptional regulator [Pseudomonadota bacterium]